MAFVYRSQAKQNSSSLTPGPAEYQKNKNKQIKYSPAPFNNSSNRQIWTKNINPGPGSYQVQTNLVHQNKLVQDEAIKMVIFQTPKPTSQFKSSTLRFSKSKNVISPGPGEYLVQKNIQNFRSGDKQPQKFKTSQLKKYLKESNYHRLRQSQQQQIYIESRQKTSPTEQHRPTTANIANKNSKNSIFFSSKVKRQERIRPQTSIGPGSYNITSNSIQKNIRKVNKTSTKSICFQKYNKQNENNALANVGPGSYEVQKSFKFVLKPKINKAKHLQCFGSTVDRFTKTISTRQSVTPGPASYQTVTYQKTIQNNAKIKKTTFGTESKRQFFAVKSNPNLAPGAYGVYNDFQKLLKDKYKSGTIGSFGSTQQRFCQKRKNIAYEPLKSAEDINMFQAKSDKQKQQNSKFKRIGLKPKFKKYSNNFSMSLIKQMQAYSKIDNRPLCYDAQTFTFSKKFKNKRQVDAPFSTCSQRFTFKDKKPQLSFLDEKVKPQSQTLQDSKITNKNTSKSKGCVSMKFTDCRFKYPQQKQVMLGPQYYNPREHDKAFAKKSFNTLFS